MIDALECRRQGRAPVLSGQYNGWMISVYRVGRRQEYQAVAEALGEARDLIQTPRVGGSGAMTNARYIAKTLVDAVKRGMQ